MFQLREGGLLCQRMLIQAKKITWWVGIQGNWKENGNFCSRLNWMGANPKYDQTHGTRTTRHLDTWVLENLVDRGIAIRCLCKSRPPGHLQPRGIASRASDHPPKCQAVKHIVHPKCKIEIIFDKYSNSGKWSEGYFGKWLVSSDKKQESCLEREKARRCVL